MDAIAEKQAAESRHECLAAPIGAPLDIFAERAIDPSTRHVFEPAAGKPGLSPLIEIDFRHPRDRLVSGWRDLDAAFLE